MTQKNNIPINVVQIMKMLPHRYPMLLVDRILECNIDHMVGIKNVSINEPYFVGHFPSLPVMPGVLILEAMAQLSALLVASSMDNTDNIEIYLMSIDNAKFRHVVQPGDQLILDSTIIQSRGNVWKFRTTAKVDDRIVSEAVIMAMMKMLH